MFQVYVVVYYSPELQRHRIHPEPLSKLDSQDLVESMRSKGISAHLRAIRLDPEKILEDYVDNR